MFPEYVQPTRNVYSGPRFLAEVHSYPPSSSYKHQFYCCCCCFIFVPEFCIQRGQRSQFPRKSSPVLMWWLTVGDKHRVIIVGHKIRTVLQQWRGESPFGHRDNTEKLCVFDIPLRELFSGGLHPEIIICFTPRKRSTCEKTHLRECVFETHRN